MIWLGVEIEEKKLNCECYVYNRKVDESGQIHLLTFRENSSRMMRELGSCFFIVIVVLDAS